MDATIKRAQENTTERLVREIEGTQARRARRGGVFTFFTSEMAARAASKLEEMGVRVKYAWGAKNALEVSAEPAQLPEAIRVLVESGGKYDKDPIRRPEHHSDPINLERGYQPPQGFKERFAHVEALREHLEKLEYFVDVSYTREGKCELAIGDFSTTLEWFDESHMRDVEALHEFLQLTRRLLGLLR